MWTVYGRSASLWVPNVPIQYRYYTRELTSDVDSISASDTHASLETEASVKLMTLLKGESDDGGVLISLDFISKCSNIQSPTSKGLLQEKKKRWSFDHSVGGHAEMLVTYFHKQLLTLSNKWTWKHFPAKIKPFWSFTLIYLCQYFFFFLVLSQLKTANVTYCHPPIRIEQW